MSEVEHQNIPKELADVAFEFLRCLYEGDVEQYWNMISNVDKARIYGMYVSICELSEDMDQSFMEFVRAEYQSIDKETYKPVKENAGIATHLRYTDEGEYLLYFLEDVQAPRLYIAETEVEVFPIVITLETEVNSGEFNTEYKVRIFHDKLYDELT